MPTLLSKAFVSLMFSPIQASLLHPCHYPTPMLFAGCYSLPMLEYSSFSNMSFPISVLLLKFFLLPGMPFTQLPKGELLLILQNANSGLNFLASMNSFWISWTLLPKNFVHPCTVACGILCCSSY